MSKIEQYILFMVGLSIVYLLSIFMFTGIPLKITPQDAFTKMEVGRALQDRDRYLMAIVQRLEEIEKKLKIIKPTPTPQRQ